VSHRTRIKICGVCRVEDALLAARAGAHAVGMVFHELSPRYVSMDRAKQIIANLPPFVTPVGLFVDADVETVRQTAQQLGLAHIQLHGSEEPEQVAALAPLTVIKAVRVERGTFQQTLDTWRQAIAAHNITNLPGFVLETGGTAAPGGTGVANDWETVQMAQEVGAFDNMPKIIAAGGLTPETVGSIVRTIRPYAVDVSTGVEESRGRKSEEKVLAFVKAVRDADSSL
jgi:phosphoribosylanthranilate isomerase